MENLTKILTVVNPFRMKEGRAHIEGYHEVYYILQGESIEFKGFKLYKREYKRAADCRAKARALVKNIRESVEGREFWDFAAKCGVSSWGFCGGNAITFQELSHFSGRVKEYIGELVELAKLSKLVFGLESLKEKDF